MHTDRRDVDPAEGLTAALVRACRALAKAGRTEDAARIAADAWLCLRSTRPALAGKLDGAMHYIARIEQQRERHVADTLICLDKHEPDSIEEATA